MPYPSHREALLICGAPTLALSGCRVPMAAAMESLSGLEARDEPVWSRALLQSQPCLQESIWMEFSFHSHRFFQKGFPANKRHTLTAAGVRGLSVLSVCLL